MNRKVFLRFVCVLLTVLTFVAAMPALSLTVSADTAEEEKDVDYTAIVYANAEERLATMKKYYETEDYALYVDEVKNSSIVTTLGVVAYVKKATGEVLFTNPLSIDQKTDKAEREKILSQIIMEYSGNEGGKLNSHKDAALKGQISVKSIKHGVRVEYSIGEISARILLPRQIEKNTFEELILNPIKEKATRREYQKFAAYYSLIEYTTSTSEDKRQNIAERYPATAEHNIDLYLCDQKATDKTLRELEALVLAYCPKYTYEQLDIDHAYAGYTEDIVSPPVFRMALEYTLADDGLVVSLSGNGMKYDESVYRVTSFQVLPYMGASKRTSDGYSFLPDGSGSLYDLDTVVNGGRKVYVYGDDYALFEGLHTYQTEVARMPVFGQVEYLYFDQDGKEITKEAYDPALGHTKRDRGFFAVIEEGESLATIIANHESYLDYASVHPAFEVRQKDKNDRVGENGMTVWASTRYTGSYQIRYMILSDDTIAANANADSYYECSWMGMACAYRDYLEAHNEDFNRLEEDDVDEDAIPLYIETFGCVDTVKKVLSMPVTVSVGLTTFEDVGTMYDYLATNGVTNVNFKLKGYANGGMYSDVPYKLKWEKSVGGSSGFKDLVEKAKSDGFGIYPDFDFVYTTNEDGGSKLSMKNHATRSIDNRYTTKRVYSATYQTLVSHFQMVISPTAYSRFYEKLEKKYSKYDIDSISLATFGNALNSDFDEDKLTLREDAKEHVITALSYFTQRDYSVMLEGGNAFTWNYADHILNVPMDSSRYINEKTAIPFMGVVLHGYVEFAGSAFNMEGNLRYAMLKAMENGASAYFVLSYANTELLKEDEVLSENYSVRYDIWQDRLVEIYHELNDVLADVQTKLIIDYENLNDVSHRVSDADELMKDIADDAKEMAAQIAAKVEADRLAKLAALKRAGEDLSKASALLNACKTELLASSALIGGGEQNNGKLLQNWTTWRANKTSETAKTTLTAFVNRYVITPYHTIVNEIIEARRLLKNAKANYDALREDLALAPEYEQLEKAQAVVAAEQNLIKAIDSYAAVMDTYEGGCVSVTVNLAVRNSYIRSAATEIPSDLLTYTGTAIIVEESDLEAFVFDNATSGYDMSKIGMKALYDAYIALLIKDGFMAEAPALPTEQNSPVTIPTTPSVSGDEEESDVRYAVDNNVVRVTFGEELGDPYKSLLLNFNDYTIQTTYNGIRYTIESYGYVVIMHD